MTPRPAEVNRLVADATRAKELLGWEAKISLDEGLKAFIQWYNDYGLEERVKIE